MILKTDVHQQPRTLLWPSLHLQGLWTRVPGSSTGLLEASFAGTALPRQHSQGGRRMTYARPIELSLATWITDGAMEEGRKRLGSPIQAKASRQASPQSCCQMTTFCDNGYGLCLGCAMRESPATCGDWALETWLASILSFTFSSF